MSDPRYWVEMEIRPGWISVEKYAHKREALAYARVAQASDLFLSVCVYDSKEGRELDYPGRPETEHADPRGS